MLTADGPQAAGCDDHASQSVSTYQVEGLPEFRLSPSPADRQELCTFDAADGPKPLTRAKEGSVFASAHFRAQPAAKIKAKRLGREVVAKVGCCFGFAHEFWNAYYDAM